MSVKGPIQNKIGDVGNEGLWGFVFNDTPAKPPNQSLLSIEICHDRRHSILAAPVLHIAKRYKLPRYYLLGANTCAKQAWAYVSTKMQRAGKVRRETVNCLTFVEFRR